MASLAAILSQNCRRWAISPSPRRGGGVLNPPRDGARAGDDNPRGIALMVFAMFSFALADMFVKLAADRGPDSASPGQIMAYLGTLSTIAFAILMARRGERLSVAVLADRFVRLRLAGELLAATTFLTALTLIPLGEAAAIQQLHPIAMTLAAAVFLRESVGPHRWAAIVVGFVGVAMIIRPGSAAFEPASLLVLASIVGLTIRDLSTRRIDARYSTHAISIVATAALIPTGILLHLLFGADGRIVAAALPVLTGAAICSTLGFYAITASMRVGETAVVAPYRYTRILAAMAIGYVVFAESPDAWTLAGAMLVILAGGYTFLRERRRGRVAPVSLRH